MEKRTQIWILCLGGITAVATLLFILVSALRESAPQETVVGGRTRMGLEAESDASAWQTYRNEEYGFELEYPATYELSENSQWSQLAPFFQVVFNDKFDSSKSFQVKVTLDTGMSEPLDIYLDHPADAQDILGGEKAGIFVLNNGYCDGPSCSAKLIALKTKKDQKLYILEFQGVSDLSGELAANVRGSFRFIQK